MTSAKIQKIFWFILAVGALLRLIGTHYGLPAVFNADEPHVVDIAVSFGAGTLNPHFFKYPTLYMYVLFAAYGVFFIFWSGVGYLHSVAQFAALFVWHPTAFYLIARDLSAAFSLAAVYPVFLAAPLLTLNPDEESGDRAGLWPAIFLTMSPVVIDSAHAAKPESLMLLLAAWAWYFAIRHRVHGRAGDLLKCGFLAGLACSAQYTAFPTIILILAAWWAWRRSSGAGVLAGSMGAAAGGFFLGCPYALLDHSTFLRTLQELHAMQNMFNESNATWAWHFFGNALAFSDPWRVGGLFLIIGMGFLLWKDRKSAILLMGPTLLWTGFLFFSGEGGWVRYLFAVFPALALIAGLGVEWAIQASRQWIGKDFWQNPLGLISLAALLALPAAAKSWRYDRELLLPDSRTLAAQWIESHIPQGSKILTDQEHASPPLRLSAETVEWLLARTKAAGHPRAHYYEIMKASHPGGGYAVYQILRSAEDLHTLPSHAAESAMGRQVLDVTEGLLAVRREGIKWVVLSSSGAQEQRSPEISRFFKDVRDQGRPVAEFSPEEGRTTGPDISIFSLSSGRRT